MMGIDHTTDSSQVRLTQHNPEQLETQTTPVVKNRELDEEVLWVEVPRTRDEAEELLAPAVYPTLHDKDDDKQRLEHDKHEVWVPYEGQGAHPLSEVTSRHRDETEERLQHRLRLITRIQACIQVSISRGLAITHLLRAIW